MALTSQPRLQLAQARIVAGDVAAIAAFYAALVDTSVALNDHYVEVAAGPASVGFSRVRFTEEHLFPTARGVDLRARAGEIILDFTADDVDAEHNRIQHLDGVTWVMAPATQPWGRRSMLFRDPQGHLVSVSSPSTVEHSTLDR